MKAVEKNYFKTSIHIPEGVHISGITYFHDILSPITLQIKV